MRSFLFRLVKWTTALAAVAGLLAVAYLIQEKVRARLAAEAAIDTAEPPKRAANKVIKLGAEFALSHGIEDQPARAISWEKRAVAYGRVVPNPRAIAEVRAAFGGILRAAPDRDWPALGERTQSGQVLGKLDIRFGPQERLDLTTKLSEARLKQKGAELLVQTYQQRYDRLRGAGDGVSQAELDTARTQLTEARTQLDTAKASVKSWQQALDAIDGQGEGKGKTWSQPLTAPGAGEITELTGRPGMAVEAGGLIARLVDFRLALVRLELPPEALSSAVGAPAEVELSWTWGPTPLALEGAPNRPEAAGPARTLKGRLLGTAPQVEVSSQYAAYWYEVDTRPLSVGTGGGGLWRPGLFVKGLVKVPGARARSAVSVPETSLLYHEGRALVYVRIGPGRYERREVQVLGREQDRWALASGVEAGESVVWKRAQVLLSEEFRAEADLD
jgi:hypothetical protein